MFGSVTTAHIASALEAQGYEIDKKKISLKENIKNVGDFSAEVRLMEGVTSKSRSSQNKRGSFQNTQSGRKFLPLFRKKTDASAREKPVFRYYATHSTMLIAEKCVLF